MCGADRMQDVSSLRDFYEVNLELALPGAPISFYEVEEGIVSTGHVLPPVLVHDCEIENSLVGEGSVLRVRAVLHAKTQHLCSTSLPAATVPLLQGGAEGYGVLPITTAFSVKLRRALCRSKVALFRGSGG